MSVVRVIFLGTPIFARFHLEKLIEDEHFDVVGVLSQPDRPSGRRMKLTPSPVKQLAVEKGLPVLTPEKVNHSEVLEQLKKWNAEAAVVVAFGQILPQSFLDLFPQKVVNVHASLLPRWRGAAPIQRAIMEGDRETGVSLQVMVKKLDAGRVLGERKVTLTDDIDAVQLHDQLMALGADLLHVEFMDYLRGHLVGKEQEESLVTYAHKVMKAEGVMNFNQSARALFNQVRGLRLGPGSHALYNGKKVKFHRVSVLEESTVKGIPGEVVAIDADHFVVACKSGALRCFEVQPESKPKMKVSEFLRGYSLSLGDKFE